MIDRTHAGWRCQTRRLIRTVKGELPRGSRGTVVYEMTSLGRPLILVEWDTGISVPVFPDEVELQREHATPDADGVSAACPRGGRP
jgi:hypothetical protein